MALRELLATFGVKVDTAPLDAAKGKLDGIGKAVGSLTGIFGGLAAAAGLGEFKSQIDDLAKESSELRAASVKAGVGFQDFQKMAYTTGLSTESLTMLFRKMQQNIASASGQAGAAAGDFDDLDGGLGRIAGVSKQAGETFKKLNVQLKGKSNAQVFQETAAAIAKVQNPAEKTALAMRVFGRSGQELLPFLSRSPEQVAELAEQFDLFGGITDEDNDKLRAYTQENKKLNLALRSLKISILSELVPAFTFLINKGNEIAKWFKQNVDTSQLLTAAIATVTVAFLLLGNTAVATALRTIGAWLAVAFPFIALGLIIDDLIHAIKGDANTATEAFLKKVFGEAQGESLFQALRRDVGGFIDDLKGVEGILDKILEVLKIAGVGFGRALNAATGGHFREEGDVAVASLGVTRKARQKAKRAIAEEELGASLPENYGGMQPSVQPSSSFAPTVPGAAAKPTNQTNTVSQTNHNTFNIYGTDTADAKDQVSEVIKGVQGDERRATLAALEKRK